MDIVFPYIESHFHELKYALRGICLYQPHFRVFLVGDKPDWYTGDHLRSEFVFGRPEFDVTKKILTAISKGITDDFILWQDDIYKLNDNPVKPVYCDTLKHAVEVRYPARFFNIMNNTLEKFPDGYYYGGHTPMVMNGKLFKEAVERTWTKDMIPKTMYGNYANIGGELIEDCKIRGTVCYDFAMNWIKDRDYFSTSHYGVNRDMMIVFNELFPEKCKYET